VSLEASQNAIGGGGRYDGLVEDLGGPATPGIGFALGIDRILMACDSEAVFEAVPTPLSVFVVDVAGGSHALAVCDDLRSVGLGADRAYGGRSMKAQMKLADRSGAPFAVIIGEDEVASGDVTLRDLRGDAGQRRIPLGCSRRRAASLTTPTTGPMMDFSTSMRTDMCGHLTAADVGRTITVCGWVDRRREHGEHLAFIDLRDHTGVLQCVIDGSRDLRGEYVARMTGVVRPRPEGTVNKELGTGEVEVDVDTVEILSQSEPAPFPMDERTVVDETIRLRHRYVDLRKSRMQRNLRTRALVNSTIRTAMERQGFVEIETPMLIASTPEGARDFVVPSRKEPGSFYALPQSPQLFKQLCMVGGFDRYYQIARCLRDEDLRADRQFEFMQLDAEASFVSQEDVFEFISEAVVDVAEAVTGERPGPIGRITWNDSMERFGNDKPDMRFDMELVEPHPGLRRHRGSRVPGRVHQGHLSQWWRREPVAKSSRRIGRRLQTLGSQRACLDASCRG